MLFMSIIMPGSLGKEVRLRHVYGGSEVGERGGPMLAE
jgi:hypothetical protein